MRKMKKLLLSITIILTITASLGLNISASEVDDPIGRCRVASITQHLSIID